MHTKQNIFESCELVASHFLKEIKAIFSDRGALLILIGAMIIYPIVYSIAYYNETLTELSMGVVDLDHSDMSRKYAQMLDATSEVKVTHYPGSLSEAETMFMNNQIEGVIVIPHNFQTDIFNGIPTNIAVYADASYFLKYRNAYMTASTINGYFSGEVSVSRYITEGKSMQQAIIASDPLSVQRHILYNPSSGYASFIMPGLILIVLQQTLLIGIGILGGSFSESKASPFLLPKSQRRREIMPYLFGKSGAYLLVSLINIAFAVIILHHWFAYPDNASALDIFVLLFPYVVAITFLGIGISTLFIHRESSIVFMVFLSPIALFLSGLSWPVSSIPGWLTALSRLMPSSTAIPAYLRLRTMGVGITAIRHELLFLYAQAFLYMILTIAYFYWRIRYNEKKSQTLKTSANQVMA